MAAPTDTIAAIATPAGAGGIGIVRVSGPAADAIGVQLLGRAPSPRQAHYCGFRDAAGELIDSGLLLAFPAPHSYTGEDVLELQAHGSPVLLNLLLARCYQLGARPARPGEFSERAYLNGKLDLAQAEAVADLIAAGSEAAARAAQRSLSGEFSRRVESLAQQLIELRVYVEAAIDFPEEEIDFLRSAELRTRFARLQQQLDDLLSASRRGQRLRDGLHAVIVGAPNVGKSSLLNALSGEDRAIVSAVPGTTRDLLREQILVGGLALTVVDTAGLRASADPIEREGIARAGREARRADLLIWVHDDGESVPSEPSLEPDWPTDLPQLHVHNKIDLRQQEPKLEQCGNAIHVHLSARSGDGLDLLRQALLQHAGLAEGGGDFSARARHVDALQRCQIHTATAHDMALEQGIGELAAEELRRAHDNLGEITGRMRSDELLGAIFSSFCIGK